MFVAALQSNMPRLPRNMCQSRIHLHTHCQVVEIILSIAALLKGLYQVVATSLLGSILSNMLFVLGMSFVAGGLK